MNFKSVAISRPEFWWISFGDAKPNSIKILIGFRIRQQAANQFLKDLANNNFVYIRRYLRLRFSLYLLLFYLLPDYRFSHTRKARGRGTGARSDHFNGALQVPASQSAGTIELGIDLESCGHCAKWDICLWTGMAKW